MSSETPEFRPQQEQAAPPEIVIGRAVALSPFEHFLIGSTPPDERNRDVKGLFESVRTTTDPKERDDLLVRIFTPLFLQNAADDRLSREELIEKTREVRSGDLKLQGAIAGLDPIRQMDLEELGVYLRLEPGALDDNGRAYTSSVSLVDGQRNAITHPSMEAEELFSQISPSREKGEYIELGEVETAGERTGSRVLRVKSEFAPQVEAEGVMEEAEAQSATDTEDRVAEPSEPSVIVTAEPEVQPSSRGPAESEPPSALGGSFNLGTDQGNFSLGGNVGSQAPAESPRKSRGFGF